jgi:hypothetical protein
MDDLDDQRDQIGDSRLPMRMDFARIQRYRSSNKNREFTGRYPKCFPGECHYKCPWYCPTI